MLGKQSIASIGTVSTMPDGSWIEIARLVVVDTCRNGDGEMELALVAAALADLGWPRSLFRHL